MHVKMTHAVTALAAAAAALLGSGQFPGADAAPAHATRPSGHTLRALAAPSGLRIGTAVNMDALAADSTYEEITGREFSTVTPENVMKWSEVQPTLDATPDYTAGDRLVTFARQHGQLVRGHTLVWHNQIPTGLDALTADQLRATLRAHIIDEVSHFKGKIWQWDVVNEAVDDDGQLRQTIWLQKLGPGYIADAFRWAHQADPKALLFYNDYNIEGVNAKSDTVYALVQQLRRDGVPINGVGVQGHLDTQFDPPNATVNLRRFEDLHLYTAVTEVDVRMPLPPDSTKVAAQAQGYSVLLRSCLLTPHCLSYTVWGFADQYSWVPGVFSGEGYADLYDDTYQAKPAYTTLGEDLMLAAGGARRR